MAGKQSIENQHQAPESEGDLLKFLPSDMFLVDNQPPPPPLSFKSHRHHPSFPGGRPLRTFPLFLPIQRRPPSSPPQRYPVPQPPNFERRAVVGPNNRPVHPHSYPAQTQVAPPFRYRAPPPGFARGTGVYIPRPANIAATDHAYEKQGGGRGQSVQRKSEVECLPEDWTY